MSDSPYLKPQRHIQPRVQQIMLLSERWAGQFLSRFWIALGTSGEEEHFPRHRNLSPVPIP